MVKSQKSKISINSSTEVGRGSSVNLSYTGKFLKLTHATYLKVGANENLSGPRKKDGYSLCNRRELEVTTSDTYYVLSFRRYSGYNEVGGGGGRT